MPRQLKIIILIMFCFLFLPSSAYSLGASPFEVVTIAAIPLIVACFLSIGIQLFLSSKLLKENVKGHIIVASTILQLGVSLLFFYIYETIKSGFWGVGFFVGNFSLCFLAGIPLNFYFVKYHIKIKIDKETFRYAMLPVVLGFSVIFPIVVLMFEYFFMLIMGSI